MGRKNELDKLEWAPADIPAVRRIIEGELD